MYGQQNIKILNLGIELSKDGFIQKHTGAMLYQRCIFWCREWTV